MTSTPAWCVGIKPKDPNDEPFVAPVIRPLHRLIGARLHCWLSFASLGLVYAWVFIGMFFAKVAALLSRKKAKKEDDDYKGLKGFLPFYMKWIYGPISDGWNRPIRGPPGKYIDVIPRQRYVKDRFKVANIPDMTAPTQRCMNMGSYNYLGYGGVFPGITERLIECVDRSGIALCTTPAEMGISAEQRRAEEAIARFVGKEDALAFPMGFATNSMVIPALVGREGLVISDELNHASIITGVRRTGATVRVFRHNDMEQLEDLLRQATSAGEASRWERILVVVEGLYSMEGELTPLREVVALKERYGALLYIDEAHSIGALGPTGRGVCEYSGVSPRHVDVLMGTFTKSLSSIGGYVAADRDTIAMLRAKAPGWSYGYSMSPPCAEQVIRSLEHLQSPPGRELIRKLRANSIAFRRALTKEHLELLGPPDTPVVPQMVRHVSKLPVFSRTLLKQGVATVIVGYPATPVTGLRARYCITGALDAAEVEETAAKIARASKELCIDFLTDAQARAALEAADRFLEGTQKCDMADVPFVAESEREYTSRPIAPKGLPDRMPRVADAAVAGPRVLLSTQDYLGIANCEEVIEAAKNTIREYGCGACGPRGFYGSTDKHLELEDRIAAFNGYEASILYSYGALVMTSVLPTYANTKQDVILYDEAVNMSTQTGLTLCPAKCFAYAHCDAAALERLLQTVSKLAEFKDGRRFIVTEGLFASSGDVAPLPQIVALKHKYKCQLIVDETQSLGALGTTGRGIREFWAERTGDLTLMEPQTIDFLCGSLETSFGSIGGFCCGTRPMMQYQVLSGLGYVFSASAPPYLCKAAVTAMDVVDAKSDEIVPALRRNVAHARASAVQRLGALYDVSGNDAESPLMMLSLRKRGAAWAPRDQDEQALQCVARACAADFSVGVCLSAHIESDTATPARPSLRVCVSARYSPDAYDEAFDSILHHTQKVLQLQ